MPLTAQGQPYRFSSSGFGMQDRLTSSGIDLATGQFYGAGDSGEAITADEKPTTNLTAWLIGAFILLVALKYATEHESAKMSVGLVGVNVWNWISVGLMATLFIVSFKTIFNKYPIRGVTEIFNVA